MPPAPDPNRPAATVKPKQKRSKARREAMVQAGVALLAEKDIDDISIAEITSSLGFSTGSFYSAFDSKSSFFVAVEERVGEQIGEQIAELLETEAFRQLDVQARFERFVDYVLELFQSYGGALKSGLCHEWQLPQAWLVHRENGQRISDALAHGLAPESQTRVRIAVQLVFGTLVNAVLHDPGPLHLKDEHIGAALKAALHPYLDK